MSVETVTTKHKVVTFSVSIQDIVYPSNTYLDYVFEKFVVKLSFTYIPRKNKVMLINLI